MNVKVLYLNGGWKYISNVKTISTDNQYFLVEMHNGSVRRFDLRLKLEITGF